MMFIDYDKLHYTIGKILLEYTPPTLRNEYERGYAEGLHRALYVIECQDKFTGWDDRKKLLQPERSEFDWSIVDAMVNGLLDNNALPNEHEAHGGDWLKDWLKNFMWEYDINPADLLMEEKDEGTVQRMSLNQFSRWVESIYRSRFEDGLREGEKEFNDCVLLTEDELRRRISDVSGIGKNRAEKAVENILEGEDEM